MMNALLHAASIAPKGQRWHPRIVSAEAHRLLTEHRIRHGLSGSVAIPSGVEMAEQTLRCGTAIGDLKVAAWHLHKAAAYHHAQNQPEVARALQKLATDLAQSVVHLRDRRRRSLVQSSAGFCTFCWRVTDNFRGSRYLCDLHRGGGKSKTAQAARRLYKTAATSILQAERQILTDIGQLPSLIGSRPLTDTLAHLTKITDEFEPKLARKINRQAQVLNTGKLPESIWRDCVPLAYQSIDSDVPESVALQLARHALGESLTGSEALQIALDRIVADEFYTARVLARAEAFLRYQKSAAPMTR